MSGLADYGRIVGRKALFIAVGWAVVYWISQPFRYEGFNFLELFTPVLGAVAGLVAGWFMATDSVEESGMTGLPLRVIIVVGAVLPMWLMEGLMYLIRSSTFGFGGWMILMSATILAMAAGVWHESSQE